MTGAARVVKMEAMRFFNTEGPVRADDHYRIPPLERIDLRAVLELVRSRKYFVLHAPRQTGKTSALLALRDLLNGGGAGGDYRCVYANFEVGQAGREDTGRAMRAMLGELARRARVTLGDDTPDRLRAAALETEGPDGALIDVLSRWARADPRPLVLLLDEIDTLVGDTLLSVLRQLRAGYDERPGRFPHSVILCGVRDVRDHRIHSTARNALVPGAARSTSSPSRCGWATSPRRRRGRCRPSTPRRPARRSRRKRCNGSGRARRGSRGWSTPCAGRRASGAGRAGTAPARSRKATFWTPRSG